MVMLLHRHLLSLRPLLRWTLGRTLGLLPRLWALPLAWWGTLLRLLRILRTLSVQGLLGILTRRGTRPWLHVRRTRMPLALLRLLEIGSVGRVLLR